MDVPSVPLATGDLAVDIERIFMYLQHLISYFAEYAPVTVVKTGIISAVTPVAEYFWPDGSQTFIVYYFQVSHDYAGGIITLQLLRDSTATGTAVMSWDALRIREGSPPLYVVTSTPINLIVTSNIVNVTSLILPSNDIVKGDIIRIAIDRDGANVADTLAGTVTRDGLTASYNVTVRLP